MNPSGVILLPQVGMLATVRNRIGWIAHVDAHAGHSGTHHLVRIEYLDQLGAPEDTLLWEAEPRARVWPPAELPQVESSQPMLGADFEALVRASRWSATAPFLDSAELKKSDFPAITAPVFGAVEIDDFQLVPLLKSLAMPRVSLLLADDVGLGKTIEAGLVLHELLIRRRIRRILIITPASLKLQWQQELFDKFALRFGIVDRDETQKLRSRLGPDANPWRVNSRLITSYHYLKQPDILDDFLTTCRIGESQVQSQLPWDLLIVDEAHNLMPSNFSGRDSDLAQMLRQITPYFEHKLFLTATPHNGHTRCFSGLLEQLDPVRFSQTTDFEPDQKARIPEVVVRRLKREIIQYDLDSGKAARFSPRFAKPVPLFFGRAELRLNAAVEELRKAVRRVVASRQRQEQLAGSFAAEILSKRLLSCPHTFADSWFRFKQGTLELDEVEASEVRAAQTAVEEQTTDDRERESRNRHAARTVGAWLKPLLADLEEQVSEVDEALDALGLRESNGTVSTPAFDERFDRLRGLIDEWLRRDKHWRDDERLIVFTEYKTTLDYLERRLKEKYGDDGAIRVLFGGDTSLDDREEIKAAFNDPEDPVRILIATDVASEGLNLQETARLLLHFEIPWNPSRLEQRNGRLDRHGQARDVLVHHFTSDDDADLRFLAYVANKVSDIREDLGSVNDVFDVAFQRRFIDMADADAVIQQMDSAVEAARGRAEVDREIDLTEGVNALGRLKELRSELDLTPASLRDTLSVALRMETGKVCLEGPDVRGRMRISDGPTSWKPTLDETLKRHGQWLRIVFDPDFFLSEKAGRVVFRPLKDTRLMHLGHPVFRHALSAFARRRFRSGADGATRWIVTQGAIPNDAEALITIYVEELAVNELRESLHHWVRPVQIPFREGKLLAQLQHVAPALSGAKTATMSANALSLARDIWPDIAIELREWIKGHRDRLEKAVETALKTERDSALKGEKARFRDRIREVDRQMKENTIEKLRKQLDRLQAELSQGLLFEDEDRRFKEMRAADLEEELEIRKRHYAELRDRLQREEKRVIEGLLPLRYELRAGGVQAFPVAIEIRLPEATQ
ncbi:MAG TPA: DISARM system SNF2-like helicase DrmD [Bryobacteraceae bacterium]|jgi:ERCC4-related helicase